MLTVAYLMQPHHVMDDPAASMERVKTFVMEDTFVSVILVRFTDKKMCFEICK